MAIKNQNPKVTRTAPTSHCHSAPGNSNPVFTELGVPVELGSGVADGSSLGDALALGEALGDALGLADALLDDALEEALTCKTTRVVSVVPPGPVMVIPIV